MTHKLFQNSGNETGENVSIALIMHFKPEQRICSAKTKYIDISETISSFPLSWQVIEHIAEVNRLSVMYSHKH